MPASSYIPSLKSRPKPVQDCSETSCHWELVTGTVQLFISGPGPQAWCAASKPNYEPGSKPGTERERSIAQRALLICIQRHREDRDAGVSHIQDALALATQQLNSAARRKAITY